LVGALSHGLMVSALLAPLATLSALALTSLVLVLLVMRRIPRQAA